MTNTNLSNAHDRIFVNVTALAYNDLGLFYRQAGISTAIRCMQPPRREPGASRHRGGPIKRPP